MGCKLEGLAEESVMNSLDDIITAVFANGGDYLFS
jgi:hypothetical protein